MDRPPHTAVPVPLQINAINKDQIDYPWNLFLSSVRLMARDHRSNDWRLARMFCLTRTTLHVCNNIILAPYFDGELIILHDAVKSIVQPTPINEITYENASNLEGGDVPTQRSGMSAQMNVEIRSQRATHSNCTKEFWLLGKYANLTGLKANILKYSITLPAVRVTKVLSAQYPVMHFMAQVEEEGESANNVSDFHEDGYILNDVITNPVLAQKSFLQRMIPHWFMEPFTNKTGDTIDQGPSNKESVILVLPNYVKQFSNDVYHIQQVREFGLLTRRDRKACLSSPDGVFPLLKRNDAGSHEFMPLCMLEMKTRGSENTVDTLLEQVRD